MTSCNCSSNALSIKLSLVWDQYVYVGAHGAVLVLSLTLLIMDS